MTRISVLLSDITELAVDAIVNAANSTLLGGGGVDGAIHRAAGSGLLYECKQLGGCPTGEAMITGGYNLPARYVIHTVGPVWRDGTHHEPDLLASCYRRSLEIAVSRSLTSIAFPCISTGAYGYPRRSAALIAIQTVREFLEKDASLEKVVFCCHSSQDYRLYTEMLTSV